MAHRKRGTTVRSQAKAPTAAAGRPALSDPVYASPSVGRTRHAAISEERLVPCLWSVGSFAQRRSSQLRHRKELFGEEPTVQGLFSPLCEAALVLMPWRERPFSRRTCPVPRRLAAPSPRRLAAPSPRRLAAPPPPGPAPPLPAGEHAALRWPPPTCAAPAQSALAGPYLPTLPPPLQLPSRPRRLRPCTDSGQKPPGGGSSLHRPLKDVLPGVRHRLGSTSATWALGQGAGGRGNPAWPGPPRGCRIPAGDWKLWPRGAPRAPGQGAASGEGRAPALGGAGRRPQATPRPVERGVPGRPRGRVRMRTSLRPRLRAHCGAWRLRVSVRASPWRPRRRPRALSGRRAVALGAGGAGAAGEAGRAGPEGGRAPRGPRRAPLPGEGLSVRGSGRVRAARGERRPRRGGRRGPAPPCSRGCGSLGSRDPPRRGEPAGGRGTRAPSAAAGPRGPRRKGRACAAVAPAGRAWLSVRPRPPRSPRAPPSREDAPAAALLPGRRWPPGVRPRSARGSGVRPAPAGRLSPRPALCPDPVALPERVAERLRLRDAASLTRGGERGALQAALEAQSRAPRRGVDGEAYGPQNRLDSRALPSCKLKRQVYASAY
ncbi:collagen alpha-1(I) chain-like [Mustela nigripes]|uniref:collagen alpha-1(I) chain-like n=1 Tax=Mustela nigripes TaxID=77151 RepID=UPI0028169038|nr:collagen alpha-1(I) chain-like [Mustela nigripes]